MKFIKGSGFIVLLTLLPGSALAVPKTTAEMLQELDVTVARSQTADVAITNVASSILDRAPFFLTALAFGAFIYSGAMYVLALGDPAKMESAKKNLGWAVIGMVAMSLVLVGIRIVAILASQTSQFPSFPSL